MAVNITTDTNTVKVTSTPTNKVTVVDNTNNTSVSVSQPTTRVIKVATIGPQGPAGAIPSTGSFATTGSNSFIGNQVITGSLIVSGSSTFTGNQIVTGSTRGSVTALSIASNTASMDLSVGNFFTLQLVAGTNTYINPSSILPGQTSILTVSTVGSATVSWPSFVKQPSGSAYIPTTTTGIDIVTLASTDSSTLYVVNVKNMI
jgi:hypothetical protein